MAVITDRLITQMQLYGAAQFTNELLDVANTMAGVMAAGTGFKLADIPATLNMGFKSLMSNTKTWVGLGAIAGFQLYEIAKQAIAVTAEFDDLDLKLTAVYGSANKGHQAFLAALMTAGQLGQTIEKTAEAEQTSAFYNLNLTEKSLQVLSGIARMRGMDLNTVVKNLGLVSLGNPRALRQLGLSRDQLPADILPKTGSSKDPAKTAQAITDILTKRFPEAAEEMSKSVEAATNRMKTAWEILLYDLAGGSKAAETQSRFMNWWANVLKGLDYVVIMWDFVIDSFVRGTQLLRDLVLHPLSMSKTIDEARKASGDAAKEFWMRMGDTPPDLPKTGRDTALSAANSAMTANLREIIGGGMIAKIGIHPSELPGMIAMRKRSTVRVELTTTEGSDFRTALESIIQKTVNAMNIHSGAPAMSG